MSESDGVPNPGSARFVLDLRDGSSVVASEQHVGLIEYSLDANGCVIDAKPCTVDDLTADERYFYEEMITEPMTTEQHTIFDAIWGDEVAPDYGSEHGGGLLGPIK